MIKYIFASTALAILSLNSGLTIDTFAAQTPCPTSSVVGSWCDDFNGNTLPSRWLGTNRNPAFWGGGTNGVTGGFTTANVSVNGSGYLVLKSTVSRPKTNSYVGTGAEVYTNQAYGYGYYETRVRTASLSANPDVADVSKKGFMSTFFNYVNDSQTEIDFETPSGTTPAVSYTGAFKNFAGTYEAQQCPPTIQPLVGVNDPAHTVCKSPVPNSVNLSQSFNTLAFNWTPTNLSYFINRTKVYEITELTRIPSAAAPLYLNFWLSNNNNFPNLPEVALKKTVNQYYLVDYVKFVPAL